MSSPNDPGGKTNFPPLRPPGRPDRVSIEALRERRHELQNHSAAKAVQKVTSETESRLQGLSSQTFTDAAGQKWRGLLAPAGINPVALKPLQLYLDGAGAEQRVVVAPGTWSAGDEDVAITEDEFRLAVPGTSKDVVLRMELTPGAVGLQYLADPGVIRYYVSGVREIVDWTIQADTGALPVRAEINPLDGEPTANGTYFVRLGRITIAGDSVTVTNYKFGHITLNLCAGGDLFVSSTNT